MQKARQLRLPGSFMSFLRLLDQVSRLAAASTIPVTNAAMQENSRMSFRTLAMKASPDAEDSPLRSPKRPRHHGQKVAKIAQKRMACDA
jgi:hypothetical protein